MTYLIISAIVSFVAVVVALVLFDSYHGLSFDDFGEALIVYIGLIFGSVLIGFLWPATIPIAAAVLIAQAIIKRRNSRAEYR